MKGGVILTLILLVSFSFVDAATHSASDIQISVSGSSMTLQSAVNGGYLKLAGYTYTSPATVSGHVPTQIWVSVKGVEKTLSTALSTVQGLCSSGSVTRYSSSAIPNPSHLGTEVELSSGKTLQKAIDDGDFCCYPSTCASLGKVGGTASDGCGNTLCCPETCSSLSMSCGSVSNGCGGTLSCGSCTSPYECKSSWWFSGYRCLCSVTTTCGGKTCGSITTNCGTTLSCGSCSTGYECQNYACVYVAQSGPSSSDTTSTEDTSHTNPFTGATGDYDGDGQTDGGSGGSSGGKLICTELYRQGLMDEEIYLADQEFGKSMKETHPEIMKGYTMFAIPIVEKMKESESFTQAVNVVVKPWSEEMAYKSGVKESGNFIGAVIMNVGMVIFWITGSLALGQLSLLFLAQMTIAVVVLVVSIYLNKNKRR